jgi:hypothetical protein
MGESGHSFIPKRRQGIALANGVVSRRRNISRIVSTRLACRRAKRRTMLGLRCGCEPELAGADVVAILPAANDKALNSFNLIVVFMPSP